MSSLHLISNKNWELTPNIARDQVPTLSSPSGVSPNLVEKAIMNKHPSPQVGKDSSRTLDWEPTPAGEL
jgi:hypothetical protein